MRLLRKYFLMAVMIWMSAGVFAQNFPSKPIKVYVGYAPGGAVDLVARTLGQSMTDFLGQPIVVENKPILLLS